MHKLDLMSKVRHLLKLARAKKAEKFSAKNLHLRDEKRLEVLTMTKQELQLFEEMSSPLALEDSVIISINSKAAIIPKSAKDKIERKSQRVLNKYKKKREIKANAEKQLLTATDEQEIRRLNNVINNNTLTKRELRMEKEILTKREERKKRDELNNKLEKLQSADPFNPKTREDVA